MLIGKQKPIFSRSMDVGDFVIIINAEKIRVTGKKAMQKVYYRHSNYPGGFKETSYKALMESHPERILEFAVDGMLPNNRLRSVRMKRLKVYAGEIPAQIVKVKKAKKPKPEAKKKAPAVAEPKVEEVKTEPAQSKPVTEAPKAEAANEEKKT